MAKTASKIADTGGLQPHFLRLSHHQYRLDTTNMKNCTVENLIQDLPPNSIKRGTLANREKNLSLTLYVANKLMNIA